MSHEKHRQAARSEHVRCAVVTVSDTRTEEDDRSGQLVRDRLERVGHEVVRYEIIPDDPGRIGALLDAMAEEERVDAILLNGGTGISARDGTYEAVSGKLDKELRGFGELFRVLSYEEIGSAAMLSRATAGVYRHRLVFSMPGSTGAVELAMDELILPEVEHLIWEVRRQQPPAPD